MYVNNKKMMWIIVLLSLLTPIINNLNISITLFSIQIIFYGVETFSKRKMYTDFEKYLCNIWMLTAININALFLIENTLNDKFEFIFLSICKVLILLISALLFIAKSGFPLNEQTNIKNTGILHYFKNVSIEFFGTAKLILMITVAVYCLFFGIAIVETIPPVLSILIIIIAVILILFYDKHKKHKITQKKLIYKYAYITIIYKLILLIILVIIPGIYLSIPTFSIVFNVLNKLYVD